MSSKEIIDKYLGKSISKTLMITLIATFGLFQDKLTGAEWTVIATAYIGATKWTETILKMKE